MKLCLMDGVMRSDILNERRTQSLSESLSLERGLGVGGVSA